MHILTCFRVKLNTAFGRGMRPKAGFGSLDIKVPSESHVCSTYIYEIFDQLGNSLQIFYQILSNFFAPRIYARILTSEKFFTDFLPNFVELFCFTYLCEIFDQWEILYRFFTKFCRTFFLHVHMREF